MRPHKRSIGPRALYFLFYGSGAAWVPLFNLYLQQVGLTGVQIGILAGLRPALALLSQPIGGILADLWGRRRALLITMPLAAILPLGFGWSGAFYFLLTWVVLHALLTNPVGPFIDSVALDHLDERPNVSYGKLRLWGAVGWAVSAFVTGNIVSGKDVRLTFVIGGLLMLTGWVGVLGMRAPKESNPAGRSWRDVGPLLRNSRLMLFLGLVALLQMGAASIFSFYPIYMNEIGGSTKLIGTAFSVQGLSELPLYLGAAALIRRFGLLRVWRFTFFVFAARAFLYSLISIPYWAVAVEALHGLSFSLFLVSSVEYINRVVPREWRATGQSLFWAANFGLGAIVGNTWSGYLYDHWKMQAVFRLNAWLILGVALLALVVFRSSKEPEAQEERSRVEEKSPSTGMALHNRGMEATQTMSTGVRMVTLKEGNPRSSDRIYREGAALVVEPYSEDGDPNYKFRLDVELVNETDALVETRIIVEWNDTSPEHMVDRTYLLVCPDENSWIRYHAMPSESRVAANIPVPPGRSRLAMHPPYDRARLLRLLDTLPRDRTTVHVIGKSLHEREIVAIEAGDPSARPLAVVTRVHPYETVASHFAEGMITWITRGGAEVQDLLSQRRVIIIPMPNPDGVEEGTCKRTLGGANFSTDIATSHEPELVAVRDYLVQERTQALFDLHGWMYDIHDYVTNDEARGKSIREKLLCRPDLFDREIDVIPSPLPKVGGENHLGGFLKNQVGSTFFVGSWVWYDRTTSGELNAMGEAILKAYIREF